MGIIQMVTPPFSVEERRQLAKVYCDMFEGDGMDNPPVVTRLDRLERVAVKVDKLVWAVIGLVLAIAGNIISEHLK